MSPPKLVIFDCDGTLVDSQDLIIQAMNSAFQREQLPAPERQSTLSVVGLSLLEAMQVLVPDQPAERQNRLAQTYKTSFGEIVADSKRKEPLYEGALEAVQGLSARADVLLGIATGKSQRGVRRLIDEHGFEGCFITIQTADDAPSKPHPAMIHQAMSEAGAHAQDTVMIGDTVYDLEMATAAGVASIGVDWGYHDEVDLAACRPQALLSHFNQLDAALDALWRHDVQVKGEGM